VSTTALSGDVHQTNSSIHTINAVLWTVGKRPTNAIGRTRVCRANPRTEFREIYLVTYEFDDGLLWTHRVQSLKNELEWRLKLSAYGDRATALVQLSRQILICAGGLLHYGARDIDSLYDKGAIRNIATFYDNICKPLRTTRRGSRPAMMRSPPTLAAKPARDVAA